MATLAAPFVVVPARRSFGATFTIFAKETKYEFFKLYRTKSFSFSVIGFPVMFYLLFGVGSRGLHAGGDSMSKYLLAGYACSGMISAALFGIGVGLSAERSAGWLELKRSSPMPPLAYLLAKCVTAQVFGVAVVALLIALSTTLGGVHLSVREAALLLVLPFGAAVPFAAMGLLLALVVPANSAPGMANLIYMPMAVLGGLWLPLSMLPKWLQAVAPMTPTYHLGQIALSIFGYQSAAGSVGGHWAALLGFTLLMLGVCWACFHRDEQNA